MLDQTNANIERHIKTHTERSDDDRSAVSVLETFLRSNGRINTSFASDDKWPNHDNTFEFVPNPDISRRPKQTFYVQIKGTRNYTKREGVIKYTLKDLAFPAFICDRVSLDPGILFVILNPAERGNERVFWKYMSPNFLNSIDFAKGSMTVSFSPEEEILNDDESVLAFCERLEEIVERHSCVNQLERHSYSFEEAKRIVEACDEEITESIDNLSIAAYEASTLFILNKLLELSQIHNKGQKEVNEKYLRNCDIAFSDPKKEEALKYAFVNSRVLLVYGAAGTGKTTLIDMIPTMLSGRRKLFLTKTHTALQNLQRRINNPGADASFVSINSFTKRVNLPDYDVIFVDECSTIDNRAMKVFLEKMRPDTFLVLAGDTYQIESIDFGNWFTYAKDIIKTKGSNVELVSTWRTKDPGLIELWNETRNKGALITEKLVIDGPFSENIGEGVLNSEIMDEVILCLNYDGKFGLNNMNSYFQNANTGTAVVWRDWKYKVGDHILFNDTDRFSLLYNNLKGRIVQIELFDSRIRFTVDVEIPLTEQDCQNDGIEFIDIIDDVTRIRFDVLDFEEEMADEDRKKAIVPFQLAYAVSIHKAQGLEYRSVKVVIPSSNAEKITHGIFYTAITRAKEKLKIYWSSETMQEVVAGFSVDTSKQKSLAIIKEKLKQDKNT